MGIAKDVVACELIYIILLYFTFLADWSGGEVLVQDRAVVAQGVTVREGGDFFIILTHTPCLHILIFIDERTQSYRYFNLLVGLLHNDYNQSMSYMNMIYSSIYA